MKLEILKRLLFSVRMLQQNSYALKKYTHCPIPAFTGRKIVKKGVFHVHAQKFHFHNRKFKKIAINAFHAQITG